MLPFEILKTYKNQQKQYFMTQFDFPQLHHPFIFPLLNFQ
nr:MAG TPA: hypothetical protein [Caudoviricetes sp.]